MTKLLKLVDTKQDEFQSDQGDTSGVTPFSNKTSLSVLARRSRDSISDIDQIVRDAMDGISDPSKQALLAGYIFAREYIRRPQEAALLPDWDTGKVREGTNIFYSPLKYAARGTCRDITSKLTKWAAIMKDADDDGIEPDAFLDVLKMNKGVRSWYDSIKAEPANDNATSAGDDDPPSAPQSAASLPSKDGTDSGKDPNATIGATESRNLGVVIIDWDVVKDHVLDRIRQGKTPGFLRVSTAGSDEIIRFLADHDPDFFPGAE